MAYMTLSCLNRHFAQSGLRLAVVFAALTSTSLAQEVNRVQDRLPRRIPAPDDLLIQHADRVFRPSLVESSAYLRVGTARTTYNVSGSGLACAVMDTGLRVTHTDFAGRVPVVRNFTTDDGSNPTIVTDANGHGSHVAGIVGANGVHTGFAPGCNVIPLKVLANSGGGTSNWLLSALDWVIANRVTHNITCVNMSLGFGNNDTTDSAYSSDAIRARITTLRGQRVAVVCAAGNSFFGFASAQGMAYPAICRETISVGALYDANIGGVSYGSGAIANTTAAGRITPFSQRLHPDVNAACRTDIFSTGAALTATGISSNTASSTLHGTSQASPTVAGLVLLAQQLHVRTTGQLPTVDQLETWLRASSRTNVDGDNENDNVTNTGKTFIEADAVSLLSQISAVTPTPPTPPPTPPSPPAAVNIAVSFSAGRLTLTGDSGNNSATIQYSATRCTVTPGTGTTLNGGTTPLSYTLGSGQRHSLVCTLGAGNDSITVNSGSLSSCNINLGEGNDSCALSFVAPSSIIVDGGTGTDTLSSTGTRFPKRATTIRNFP